MERDFHTSFLKGEEEGESNAVAKYTARRKSMDKKLDLQKRQMQLRQKKNSTKKKNDWKVSQETVLILSTLPAEIAAQAQKIAAQARETDRPNWCSSFSENNEKIKRVSAELVSYAGIFQQRLVAKDQSNTHLQNQLTLELLYQQEAKRSSHRGHTRGAQELGHTHSGKNRQLRIQHLQESDYIARLQDLQARLEQQHAGALKK